MHCVVCTRVHLSHNANLLFFHLQSSENTTVNDVEGEKSVVDLIADDSENSMFLMMGTKVLKENSLSNASPLLRQSSNSKSGFNRTESTDPANR